MLTLNSVLQVAPGVITRESGDELVVVLPAQGKYLVLNGTGAAIFRRLDGETSLQMIAETLSHDYQAPLDKVQADVLALVTQLLERELLLDSEN